MKYIFFDIECANCQMGQAKICSFGYVITDERFEVLEKEDIVVNPRAPFMLTGHGNKEYIKLAYTQKEFRSAPDFPAVYQRIRKLLESEDCLIFGYAADNDASYLKCEFQRYNLNCINFTYYDLQKMLRFYLPDAGHNQISLLSAAAMFEMQEIDQEIHKSDDDAFLTMLVLRGICRKSGHSPVKLLETYPVCRGDLLDNKVLIRIPEGRNLLVKILGDKSDRIAPKSENRVIYTRFIRHVKPSGRLCPQWLKGKRVCIPEKYAERHYTDTIKLIQLICDCGGRYTGIPEDCHVFVTYPVYNDDGSLKVPAEMARIQKKRPSFRPKIHDPEQFLSLCALTAEEFAALPMPEVKYLLDERYAPQPKSRAPGEHPPRRTPPVKKDHERVVIIPPEKK